MQPRIPQEPLVSAFVGLSAISVFFGWALSPPRWLTPGVYPPLLLALLLVFVSWMILDARRGRWRQFRVSRLLMRLRRPVPLIFFLALALGLAGGLIYAPNNYDALSYRIPRVLNWISDAGWSWIPTANVRMNFSGSVQEWLFCPFLMTFHSDRLLFVFNVVSFALTPGLVFSLFHRLGILPRVAWWWMWLVPLSMGLVLQAGGVGNDLLGFFFFLVALETAARFGATGSSRVLFCSIVSMGLCTGVKLSNLPLVLPWLALLTPAWKGVRAQAWRFLLATSISLSVSILPTLALNWANTGSWTGDPTNQFGIRLRHPIAGVVGNTIMIAANNLAPPILPLANQIEAAVNAVPAFGPGSWLKQRFPDFRILLNELPQEEASGVGLLIVLLLIWSIMRSQRPAPSFTGLTENGVQPNHVKLFFVACAAAVLSFLAILGTSYAARLFLPYTLPVIALLLRLRDSSRLVRSPTWGLIASIFGVATLVVVVLSPSRPLFPVNTAIDAVRGIPPASIVERARTVYATYAQRADVFAEVREDLDRADRALGFLSSGDDLEASLWRPYGSRRIVHILPESSPLEMTAQGVNKALVSHRALQSLSDAERQQLTWLLQGRVLATYRLRQSASKEEDLFILVGLDNQ